MKDLKGIFNLKQMVGTVVAVTLALALYDTVVKPNVVDKIVG